MQLVSRKHFARPRTLRRPRHRRTHHALRNIALHCADDCLVASQRHDAACESGLAPHWQQQPSVRADRRLLRGKVVSMKRSVLLLAILVAACRTTPPANPYSGRTEALLAGAKLFRAHCATCHGATAEGKADAPNLRSARMHE